MLRLWRLYQKCMEVHPVKTQVISSGILWGLGDIGAQAVTHSTLKNKQKNQLVEKEFKINWQRVGITSMFGFAFVGPVGNYWYEYLDRFIRLQLKLQPKTPKFVAAKVAGDCLLFGPLDLLIFFSYIGFASGKNVEQVKEDVKRDFLPSLVIGGGIWPLVQIANFRYVPVRYQLLYVNFFCLIDSCFLSWIEQQGDAAWKQWFKSFISLENQEG
ncbi:protein Mpv17 [Dendrobium catenatum]|uniref:Peroxisomal membrane protein PMP22 n=1 Tax=Dendrobium catenatum TaxID=906689 RepID=A0A2I0VUH6_9ASPA|nr:protein Mpv17 [Dendrobium catenatum]PKU67053.1 Peroxisomal membrane protein PMP22 [Dendrobium catenatum]